MFLPTYSRHRQNPERQPSCSHVPFHRSATANGFTPRPITARRQTSHCTNSSLCSPRGGWFLPKGLRTPLGPGDYLLLGFTLVFLFFFSGLSSKLWPGSDGSWQLRHAAQTPLVVALSQLPVMRAKEPTVGADYPPYRRELFGPAWSDVDGNGCDTRNDILFRDLRTPQLASNRCQVQSGVLQDPYTGQEIQFLRGRSTSSQVQIDHVVALGNAWKSGAFRLSAAARKQLANDPLNLLAVSGPANQKKSDQDASDWLPPNPQFRCPYAARQIAVKRKYGLAVTRSERLALAKIVVSCPRERLPE